MKFLTTKRDTPFRIYSNTFGTLSGIWEMWKFRPLSKLALFLKYKYFSELFIKTAKNAAAVFTYREHIGAGKENFYLRNCIFAATITLSVKDSYHVQQKVTSILSR